VYYECNVCDARARALCRVACESTAAAEHSRTSPPALPPDNDNAAGAEYDCIFPFRFVFVFIFSGRRRTSGRGRAQLVDDWWKRLQRRPDILPSGSPPPTRSIFGMPSAAYRHCPPRHSNIIQYCW